MSSSFASELSVPLDDAYAAVSSRLRARRPEIEQAVLARVYVVSNLSEAAGPKHSRGLRTAVSAALDYGFAGIDRGEDGLVSPPRCC
jgi:hypothetical protein